MSDSDAASTSAAPTALPKKGRKGSKTQPEEAAASKSNTTHPKTSDMVNAAIKNLQDRKGSSVQAIKKYIFANYDVDPNRSTRLIYNYLNSGVKSGHLVQTKGSGARGSFKLAADKSKPKIKEGKTAKPKIKEGKTAKPKIKKLESEPGTSSSPKKEKAKKNLIKKKKVVTKISTKSPAKKIKHGKPKVKAPQKKTTAKKNK